MKNITIIILSLWSHLLFCQIEIVPEVGSYFYAINGINEFDSIRVETTNRDLGEITVGFLLRKNVSDRFLISTRFTYRPNTVSASTYNFREQCNFCPVEKISFFAYSSFLVNPNLEVKLKDFLSLFDVYVSAGLAFSLNSRSGDPPVNFNGRHSGVAEAINSYNKSVKRVSFSPGFGVSILRNNIQFSASYLPPTIFTEEVVIFSERSPFSNSWEFLSFSLGYRFVLF